MTGRPPARRVRTSRVATGYRAEFFAMGGPCELLTEERDAGRAARLGRIAAEEAWRVEDRYSRYRDGNIVARINAARGNAIEVDPETARLLDFAAELHALSAGRFDITSGALRAAWTFDGSDRVPDQSAVRGALSKVGWSRVRRDGDRLEMAPGMEIDFGGICKEYAVDRAAALVREASTAGGLVNFGGDLAVTRPSGRRSPWQVGIEPVDDAPGRGGRVVELETGALATSGDARRYLLKDGVRYGHILDPLTGWPVADAPRSVTVAADTCTEAGVLSTLAMVEGASAESFLKEQGARAWVLR